MFQRIGIAAAVIALIVVVAAAVAPYFVGRAAEANFKAQIAYINTGLADRGLHLHVDSYYRGWYSSDADISLTAMPGRMSKDTTEMWAVLLGSGSKPPVFHLHINHGPVPFDAFGYGHWNFMPVLYTAEFQGKKLPPASLFGVLKPDVYIVQYFTGNTHTRFTIPPGRFSLGIAGAKWQGGHLAVELNVARDRSHYTGVLKPITVQFENPKSGHGYSGEFKGLHFSGSPRKAKYDFWVGTGQYAFGGLFVDHDGARIVELAPGHGQAKQTETGNGRWLNSSVENELGGGTIHGWKFSRFTGSYAIAKLDARGWRRMADSLRQQAVNSPQSTTWPQQLRQMMKLLPLTVTPETTASLNVRLTAPTGTAGLSARVAFTTAAAANAVGPGVLHTANATVNLGFDHKLVDAFDQNVLGAPTAASVDQALQAWVGKGYLQEKNGRYHTVIRYLAGIFTANGHVLSTSALTAPRPATGP